MTKSQLNQAIETVANATNQTKQEVADKMTAKDNWTWFLIREAA